MRVGGGTGGGATGANAARVGCAALDRNDATYRWLVEWLHGVDTRRDAEAALECVVAIADYAAFSHPGRFADGAVENVAHAIGARLDEYRRRPQAPDFARVLAPRRGDHRPHVMHVMTVLEVIGGGTRGLTRWIRADGRCRHTVVVTDQGCDPVPPPVAEAVAANGGAILLLPPVPLLDRAIGLRAAVRHGADLVFLHHRSHDVVPTVALAAPGGPPVAVANDADHMFWLGSTAADAILNWRTIGRVVSERRRFVRYNLLLPLPLDDTRNLPRAEARKALGIPDDQVVLVSVGRGPKYRPDGRQNFFRTARAVLDNHPAAHVYVVGVTAADAAPHLPPGREDGRLHLLGPLKDPSPYQAAADLYLEGFPFGSQNALLEAALAGVPAVPACDPPCRLLVADDDPVNDLLVNAPNEPDYLARVGALIRDPGERRRLGAEFRDRLLAAHTGEGWVNRLHGVYAELGAVRHQPGPIPVAECERTDADRALSTWLDGITAQTPGSGDRVDGGGGSPVPFDVAHRLRERGYYRESCRVLWKAARSGGDRGKFARAIGKLPLHWAFRQVGLVRGA
jgi:hypothetical protein